jgi:TonB family protein
MMTVPVGPTVLLIGVNEQGEVPFQVLQQSSGDSKLDNLAIAHLRRLKFAPATVPMAWAHVTFAWGADAYIGAGERPPRAL